MAGLLRKALVVLAVLTVGTAESAAPDVLVAVPSSLAKELMKQAGPVVDKAIDSTVLPTCCYDDVGVDHVHLDLTSLKVSNAKSSFSAEFTTAGVNVSGTVALTVSGFLRLCVHDDPFGHGCSTLFDCKGDFAITPTAVFSALFPVSVKSGVPVVTATNVHLAIPSLAMPGLCDKAKDEIQQQLPTILKTVSESLPGTINKVLEPILAKSVAKIEVPGLLSVQPVFAQLATTSSGDLVVAAHVNVQANKTGALAPWVARAELPNVTSSGNMTVELSDALVNNILFALSADGLLVANTTVPAGLHKWNVSVTPATKGIDVKFSASSQEVLLNATLTGVREGGESFSTNITATASFEITLKQNSSKAIQVIAQLSSAPTLQNTNPDDCPIACKELLAAISLLLPESVGPVNTILANHPLSIQVPPGISVTNPTIKFGEGFAAVITGISLTDQLELPAVAPAPITCPAIPNAHLDKCV